MLALTKLNTRLMAYFLLGLILFGGESSVAARALKKKEPGPKVTEFRASGKTFKLIEYMNSNRQVVRQILVAPDFYQIQIDKNGDGQLDSWEQYTPNMSIRMRGPQYGHFTFMDVERKLVSGMQLLKFYRTPDGKYALYSSSMRPHQTLGYSGASDFVVGCREQEQGLQVLAAQMNDVLGHKGSAEDTDFKKALGDQVVQKSCADPAFDKTAIADAIYRIAGSDKGFQGSDVNTLKSLPKPAEKGMFLQCLRYYGLDAHASRIGAAFAQYTSRIKGAKFAWTVECDANLQSLGDFDNIRTDSAPVIRVAKAAAQTDVSVRGPGVDATTAYAETIFHELLHYSLISDEKTTYMIQYCCSSPKGADGTCENLKNIVSVQSRAQIIEGQVVKNLGNNYQLYRNALREAFGDSADTSVDEFYTTVAKFYNAEVAKPECHTANSNQELTAACRSDFQKNMNGVIQSQFSGGANSQCVRRATAKVGDKAQDLCARLEFSAQNIFAIEISDNSKQNPCVNHKINPAEKAWNFFFSFAWAEPIRSGMPTDYQQEADAICKIANEAHGYTYDFSKPTVTEPVAIANPMRISPVAIQDDSLKQTNESAKASPDPTETQRWSNPDKGPKVTSYSGTPTERESKILADLNRSQSLGSQMAAIGNKVAAQILPQAGAQTRADDPSHEVTSRDSNQPSARSSGGSVASSSAARLPAQVSDLTSGAGATANAMSAKFASGVVGDPLASPAVNAVQSSSSAAQKMANGSVMPAPAQAASERIPAAAPSVSANGAAPGNSAAAVGGGFGGASASSPGLNKNSKEPLESPEEREKRELKTLLKSLQRPFEVVRLELSRPSMIESLREHLVQVIDDRDEVIGSGHPKIKLIYDVKVKRLIIEGKQNQRAEK